MDETLPRPNNLPPITIRKSAFGRTNLFLTTNSTLFKEVKCSASTMTRQATASIYHVHNTNDVESMNKCQNMVCWHCCHNFDTVGFRLPRSYDPSEQVYHVYGWFCSANCGKAFILEHSTFDRGYQMNVFVRMLREVYGISSGITEAPPRISLRMFGGPFDIETFRNQKNVCYVVHPPFVSYCMLIEERQPIESMGETGSSTKTNNMRGTVKGLRRPDPNNTPDLFEEYTGPECGGSLYSDFVKQKKDVDGDDDMNIDQPDISEDVVQIPKKQKISKKDKENKDNKGKGLGRFMCK